MPNRRRYGVTIVQTTDQQFLVLHNNKEVARSATFAQARAKAARVRRVLAAEPPAFILFQYTYPDPADPTILRIGWGYRLADGRERRQFPTEIHAEIEAEHAIKGDTND